MNKKLLKTDDEWKNLLTPQQFNILREKGTEPAGFSEIVSNHQEGNYSCVACDNLIFNSEEKFDSGTGWPSFSDVATEESVILKSDSDGIRTEVLCWRCEGHLGHVFDDGPEPTGKRYCMNGAVFKFKEKIKKAAFAAGCFWGVQSKFSKIPGVIKTVVGYSGGNKENPNYGEVSSGKTGHAESILIEYALPYEKLLEKFWEIHDPTTLNKQGADLGSQYRSIIFYYDEEQEQKAKESKKQQEEKLGKEIVTEIIKIEKFWNAEEYHQNYILKNGK
jgi:peptide methionine sulfoxide reductase msrA/msrB